MSCSAQEEVSVDINLTQTKEETTKTKSNPKFLSAQPLNPTPIKITIADLPQPYATRSIANRPNVIPVPTNPSLKVPAGFQVNVFAEGLNRPRWMSLTSEGDILVAESYDNRLRILSDRDGDGVAEISQIFATSKNGIDQPLGNGFY